MSPLLVFIYILFTSTLSGAIGMGGGVILMAIFLFFLPLPEAIVLHGITQASSNGFRALLNKKYIDKKITFQYLIGAGVAYFLFQFISFKPSKNMIFIILGVLPFLTLLKKTSTYFDIEKGMRAYLCGILVSISQAMSGVSGSILDIFYLSSSLGRFSIVATKAMTQTVGHTLKTLYFVQLFDISFESISIDIYMIAFITPLLGGYIGKLGLRRFDDKSFFVVAKSLTLSLSAYLFYKGAVGYMALL